MLLCEPWALPPFLSAHLFHRISLFHRRSVNVMASDLRSDSPPPWSRLPRSLSMKCSPETSPWLESSADTAVRHPRVFSSCLGWRRVWPSIVVFLAEVSLRLSRHVCSAFFCWIWMLSGSSFLIIYSCISEFKIGGYWFLGIWFFDF